MDQQTFTKLLELIQQGEKMVPEGGHEFSGYNAKMQSQYLMWRKSCLDSIAKIGVPANALREKITKDENGAYFYQNSAQLILDTVKLALPLAESEVKKSAPVAAKPAPVPQKPESVPQRPIPQPPPAAARPEPPKPVAAPITATAAPVAAAAPSSSSKQVLVLSSSASELQNQLTNLLKEMGIEGIMFQRGTAADAIVGFLEQYPTVKYAYYLYNPDDINSAMFELGYLIGKVGSNRVCCIHHQNDAPPKGIPGITYKEIVVKLEEISFSLIKDLKAAGYTVTF
ncbi:MAG: TIR domain-containing protein [Bacteriovoracaceae bacterium]